MSTDVSLFYPKEATMEGENHDNFWFSHCIPIDINHSGGMTASFVEIPSVLLFFLFTKHY